MSVPGELRPLPAARGVGLGDLARRIALSALEGLEGGELALTFPDGSVRRFGDASAGPSLSATVTSDDLFRRLVTRGRTGLGEAYVAGDWLADDLPGVLALLVRGAETVARRRPWSTLAAARARTPHVPFSNTVRRARRQIAYHYDLGNDLYRLFLDEETMAYSCAYFERPGQSLEDAQRAKFRRLAEKLALSPSDRVLEIGCGFGGFAIHAAREHGCRVTGVTISREQHDLARERVRSAGLEDRVEIRFEDYRLVTGTFTKIASIEMIEAIGERQHATFFRTLERLLAPGGLVGLQAIAVPDQRYERYRRGSDWIREHVFPGSLIPSLGALVAASTRGSTLLVQDVEDIGIGYADTLAEWRRRFHGRLDDVRALGYDERFVRTWDFYLASCEALFRARSLRDLQLVLTRPFNDSLPPHPSARVSY